MHKNKLQTSIQSAIAVTLLAASSHATALTLSTEKVDLTFYGFARLNATYDFKEDISTPTRAGNFARLGGADENIKGHFGADAYQSRLGLKVAAEEGYKLTIETDFRGGPSGQLRLRHAFGEYNGWLVGQTWSNYTSFVGVTPTLDLDGTPGLAGRQDRIAQVRYTTGGLSVALEHPKTSVVDETNVRQGLPAFSARYENAVDSLRYSVGGFAHQVSVDNGKTDASKIDDSAFGFAGYVAASLGLTDSVTLHGIVNYSDGVGTGLYRSGDNEFVQDAYMKGNSLKTLSGYGGSVGTSIALPNGRSVNLTYGFITSDWDDAEADLTPGAVDARHETNEKASLNYLWTPVANTMMGVEYAYYNTKLVDGDKADAHRLMFSAQYNF